MEDTTTGQEVENLDENDTQNDQTEATEDTTSTQEDSGDGEKKELSVYEQELAEFKKREEELKAQIDKNKDIIDKKNRALEAEKKKAKDNSEVDKLREELNSFKASFKNNEVKDLISRITNDPAERELIERHYNTSIVKSGNVSDDLQNALAIANRTVVMEQRRNKALEEGNENFLASFAKGNGVKGEQVSAATNPIQREAEALVRSINPKAVAHVKGQFN